MEPSLESLGYFKQDLLREFASGRKVFKGYSLRKSAVVVIQEQYYEHWTEAQAYHQEILQFRALAHPNSGKILDSFVVQGPPAMCCVVQLFLNHSLSELTKAWSEPELWLFLLSFLELFDDAQRKKIYHRNISIDAFWSDDLSQFRICDFSGHYYMMTESAYISPAVKRYLLVSDEEDEYGSALPFHNPYKSEVYSLAVVMLQLMHGRYLKELEIVGQNSAEVADRLIVEAPCSQRMKDMLRNMIAFNELDRLDPGELLMFSNNELDLSNPEHRSGIATRHNKYLSIIEVKMDSQSYTEVLSSKSNVLTCVCCFVPIRVEASTAPAVLKVLVSLECYGKNHLFCGVDCMVKFAIIQTGGNQEAVQNLRCPICEYRLPQKLIDTIQSNLKEKRPIDGMLKRTLTRRSIKPVELSLHKSTSPISPLDIENHSSSISCIQCGKPVSNEGIPAHQSVFDVPTHQFCGGDCLQAYFSTLTQVEDMDHSTLPCPVLGCHNIIRAEDISGFLVGGMDAYLNFWTSNEAVCEYPAICLRCGIIIPMDQLYIISSQLCPVFLYCNPQEHIFCSKRCFQCYIQTCTNDFQLTIDSAVCPKCRVLIEPELIFAGFNGEANFLSIMQEVCMGRSESPPLCMECRIRPGKITKCGHLFCEECMQGWFSIVQKNNPKKVMPCPVCNQGINLEGFRKGRSFLRTIWDITRSISA